MKVLLPAKFLFLAFFLSLNFSKAQEEAYFSVLEKKDLITLNKDFSVTYKSIKTIEIFEHRGLDHANLSLPSDKFNKILNFEATISSLSSGKVIKKVRLKDLREVSYIDNISLYDDTKLKVFELDQVSLPVRVEILVERISSSNFFIDSWYPISYYNQLVKSAGLEIRYPQFLGLRFREEDLPKSFVESRDGENVLLSWELSNLPVMEPGSDEVIPIVEIAPKKFSLDGFSSSMETWEGLGSFIGQLNRGKDNLPEKFKEEVLQMIEGVEDPYEKVAVLYNHLQKNYRYVAISLGIGGWMPRSADEVISSKYGECKALTTLMKGMLSTAGINSQYSLVYAGENAKKLHEDFPINRFNHAFLRVPLDDEVIWLECTNNFLPAGFSGDFTMDRDVLVITEKGGYLDRTPNFKEMKFNSIKRQFVVSLENNGDAKLVGENRYFGFPSLDYFQLNKFGNEKQSKDFLNKYLGGNGVVLLDFNIQTGRNREIPFATVSYEGVIQRFGQETAKRIILPTHWKKLEETMLSNGTLSWEEEFLIQTERKFEIESQITDVKFNGGDFSYWVDTQLTENGIVVKNKLEIMLPEDFSKEEMIKLVAKINNQLQQYKLLLKKAA
ncbi:DUF3857 domain-containing protein [Shivajiella indica]|uniref:DUF3857 domain-containing protein n=1 Tax=Shivajiella indica TaxID=872115 RepID=A0ABW5B661_9BACT